MLSKKGPSSSFPSPLFPCTPSSLSLYLHSSLSSLLAKPLLVLQSHTEIKITPRDPTADTTSTATCHLRLLSVEDQQSGHLTASIFLRFCSQRPQCCCFLICGVRGVSMILLVFFISKMGRGGGYVRAAFPHLGLTKHTPWRPVLPLSPSVSHTPPLPSLLPHLSLFVCTVWTIVLVNNYYSTPAPPKKVGKYNSIFLCALGNLYNSILNLNETIKTCWKTAQERRSWKTILVS